MIDLWSGNDCSLIVLGFTVIFSKILSLLRANKLFPMVEKSIFAASSSDELYSFYSTESIFDLRSGLSRISLTIRFSIPVKSTFSDFYVVG